MGSSSDILLYSVSATTIGTVTGNVANGAEIYNDYLYITTGTDVSRYGPLSGSPALTNSVWTGATLGSQTALTNTTYPTINGAPIPKHWMYSRARMGSFIFLIIRMVRG